MATPRASVCISVAFALLMLLVSVGQRLQAQVICRSLKAQTNDGPLLPGLTRVSDTERLQQALEGCGAGRTVELRRSRESGDGDFFAGPLTIPANVTLQLAPGVELHASSPTLGIPMIETGPGAALVGAGVISAQPSAAASDLIRSDGSLTILHLALRAAPAISIHHLTCAPLWLDGVSIVSVTQPLLLESWSTPVTVWNSTFGGAMAPTLPEDASLSGVSVYSGIPGKSRCHLKAAQECIASDLPPILTRFEVSRDQVLSAIFTPAELATPPPAGLVDFFIDGVLFGSEPISGNAASIALPPLGAGRQTFTAKTRDGLLDLGRLRRNGSSPSPAVHSTTSLSTARARVPFGTSVVLSVTVTPATSGGSITLTDTGLPLSTMILNGGVATFTSDSFATGVHAIVATYPGDQSAAPSQSPPLTLIVTPDTTNLQLSPLPAIAPFGSLPPLMVSVTPPTATGLVTLHDLASGAVTDAVLSNGAASFPLTNLTIGSHTLSVTYAGDSNDAASASISTTTRVTLIPTSVELMPVPGSASYGTPIALNAQLSPAGAGGTITFTDSVAGQIAQLPAASIVSTVTGSLGGGPAQPSGNLLWRSKPRGGQQLNLFGEHRTRSHFNDPCTHCCKPDSRQPTRPDRIRTARIGDWPGDLSRRCFRNRWQRDKRRWAGDIYLLYPALGFASSVCKLRGGCKSPALYVISADNRDRSA